jgi:3-phenylpropionate/trans-cinnamate dioxygenase ferredoxin reductase subunit
VHDGLPYVWTDQLGARLQIFGQVRPQDELRVVFGDLEGSFVAVTGGDGQLRSVMGFGAIKQLMPYRKVLLAGAGWDEALALG